jgi:hypothetical protein
MKLAHLQQSFQSHLLKGDGAIAAEIAADPRFATSLRLGMPHFARLITDFVKVHPSRFRSARAYGDELPEWLAARLSGPRATGLADLARFEWAVAGAFDAADDPALKAESLAAVAPARWPALQFTFSPTLRRLSVSSNCVAWWKFACAEQARPRRWRSTCTQHWLVWRADLAVFYRRLSRAENALLDAALAGRTFGELCEQLSGAAAAAALLHGWFDAGLIVGYR